MKFYGKTDSINSPGEAWFNEVLLHVRLGKWLITGPGILRIPVYCRTNPSLKSHDVYYGIKKAKERYMWDIYLLETELDLLLFKRELYELDFNVKK